MYTAKVIAIFQVSSFYKQPANPSPFCRASIRTLDAPLPKEITRWNYKETEATM